MDPKIFKSPLLAKFASQLIVENYFSKKYESDPTFFFFFWEYEQDPTFL